MCRNPRILLAVGVLAGISMPTSARADIWYVDQNATGGANDGTRWRDAFLDLQSALDPNVVAPGDQIWVANGTYRPSVQYCVDCPSFIPGHATFRIPSGVQIYGGFLGVTDPNDPNTGEQFLTQRDEEDVEHLTILSGDPNTPDDPSDDALHVVTAHNVSEFTKLSGFTIFGGNAVADPNNPYDRMGGAILVAGTRENLGEGPVDIQSSLQITRCVIHDTQAELRGGGVAITWTAIPEDPNDVRPARIVNCTFINNLATSKDPNLPTVGGGAAILGAAYEITNSVFYSNAADLYGAGVSVEDGEDPNLLPIYTRGAITNCTFKLNKSPRGAGIYAQTFVYTPVNNTICWDDGSADPENDPGGEILGTVDVSYSDIEFPGAEFSSGSYPGSNLNVDPLFCESPPAPLLSIDANSLCVDAGLDFLVPVDAADVDDDSNLVEIVPWDRRKERRQIDSFPGGERVEIGAYETGPDSECPGDIDNDGDIDLTDLAILLTNFGLSGLGTCPPHPADVNADGNIDLTDLSLLLEQYGGPCEGDSMIGDDDPLTQWLRTATPQEVLDWWNAGMPPIGGGEDQ